MQPISETRRGLHSSPSYHTPSPSPRGYFPSAKVSPLPAHSYPHRPIWLRALRKLRAQIGVNRLGKEIHLYGANTLQEDRTDLTQIEAVKKMLQSSGTLADRKQANTTVFVPSGAVKVAWGGVYALLMLYTAFVMPFRMSFYEDTALDEWFVLDNVINVLFFLDILITLNTAIYSEEGAIITARKTIFLTYLRTWLLIDIAACIPFNLINKEDSSSGNNSSQFSRMLRLLRLPRLYRLLRLARIFSAIKKDVHNRMLERLQECLSLKHGTLRFIFFLLSFILAVHLMACLWYFIPAMEEFGVDTWVVRYGIVDNSVSDKYINCIYWTMTTLATVGYGDIIPSTVTEKIVAIGWMLFGVFFFSFVVGSIANMINSADTKRNMLISKLAAIDEFAAECNLSKDLRYRLRYALRYSTNNTGFSMQVKRGILTELPRNLRFEVALAMHHGAAKSVPFFIDRDQAFTAATVPFLNSLQVQPGEAVYSEGDYADEVYFIVKGSCAVMWQDVVMKKFQRGSYFGEIEVILAVARKHAVQAIVKADLLSMGKKLLRMIQEDFPSIYEEMREIALVRDQLNEKSKHKFQGLFVNTRRINRSNSSQKGHNSAISERKRPAPTSEDRLESIESSIKEIRSLVLSLTEGKISPPACNSTYDGETKSAETGQFLFPGQGQT
jgi:CRP-like cAMP-binding protein